MKVARRSDAIPGVLKLAATLRFLAQESYQLSVGQDFLIGMSESSVCSAMSEVLPLLESTLCPTHINFEMTNEEKQEAKSFFLNKNGFPGVIMVVDGTLVATIRPNKNEQHFFSRKGYHGLNVMLVCIIK